MERQRQQEWERQRKQALLAEKKRHQVGHQNYFYDLISGYLITCYLIIFICVFCFFFNLQLKKWCVAFRDFEMASFMLIYFTALTCPSISFSMQYISNLQTEVLFSICSALMHYIVHESTIQCIYTLRSEHITQCIYALSNALYNGSVCYVMHKCIT